MIAEVKVVRFQWLAVGVQTFQQLLLDRKGAGAILPAIEHHGRTFDFTRGFIRMARPDFARLFIAHRRIVSDERARRGCRRDEVDADAPAHAVADHADPRTVDVVARKTIAPAAVDDADEIGIRRFVLNLSARVDVLLRRIAEHVIEIRNHRCVTKLSELVSRSF